MQVWLSARNDRWTESAPRRHSFEGSEAFAALGSLATCGVMSRILTFRRIHFSRLSCAGTVDLVSARCVQLNALLL